MADAGLDAIVAASPANVRYVTGYGCWIEELLEEWMIRPGATASAAQESFAVLRPGAEPTLLVAAGVAPEALGGWAPDVRVFGALPYDGEVDRRDLPAEFLPVLDAHRRRTGDDAPSGLAALLRDLGLGDAVVGADRDGMAPRTLAAVADALPQTTFRNCSNLLRLIRMVKSDAELEVLERAALLNERAATEVLRDARPGDSIDALQREFAGIVGAAGGEFDHFATGPWGLGGTTSSRYTLRTGDAMCVDYGCRVQGYFADAGVTLALGGLGADLARRYEALRAAILEIGVAAVVPGAPASSVHEAMSSHLAKEGISGCFPHGHGLGLEIRDYPILVPDTGLRIADDTIDIAADLPLEPGMVVNLEVTQFVPGVASLEVEISVVVTETGGRPFVPQGRETPVEPEPELAVSDAGASERRFDG
jgi:Xaa-Pro aminopeptidase